MLSRDTLSRNYRAGPSTHSQSISFGKKRKHQQLLDVFDDSNAEDTEDKGRKMTKKFQQSKSTGESCNRALTTTEFSKRSRSASSAKTHKQGLPPHVSEGDDTQDKKVRKKMKIQKVVKVEEKYSSDKSSKEPCRGILRNAVKPESSQHPSSTPSSTCAAKPNQHGPLPDIYGGDLDKHASQDQKIMDILEIQKYDLNRPSKALLASMWLAVFPVVITVIGIAQGDDPQVPLLSNGLKIYDLLRDVELQKVVQRCYTAKSFQEMRNHPAFRVNHVRFLDSVVIYQDTASTSVGRLTEAC